MDWTNLLAFVMLILVMIPLSRIFRRAGFSWAWCLLCVVPYLGWLAAWMMLAFRDWPEEEARF